VAYYSARQDPANQVSEDVQIAADYVDTKKAIGPSGLMASSTLTARKVTMAGERYPDDLVAQQRCSPCMPPCCKDVCSHVLHIVMPSVHPAAARPNHAWQGLRTNSHTPSCEFMLM